MNVTSEACDLSGLQTANRKVERDGGTEGDESNDEWWKEKAKKETSIYPSSIPTFSFTQSQSQGLLQPKSVVIGGQGRREAPWQVSS